MSEDILCITGRSSSDSSRHEDIIVHIERVYRRPCEWAHTVMMTAVFMMEEDARPCLHKQRVAGKDARLNVERMAKAKSYGRYSTHNGITATSFEIPRVISKSIRNGFPSNFALGYVKCFKRGTTQLFWPVSAKFLLHALRMCLILSWG